MKGYIGKLYSNDFIGFNDNYIIINYLIIYKEINYSEDFIDDLFLNSFDIDFLLSFENVIIQKMEDEIKKLSTNFYDNPVDCFIQNKILPSYLYTTKKILNLLKEAKNLNNQIVIYNLNKFDIIDDNIWRFIKYNQKGKTTFEKIKYQFNEIMDIDLRIKNFENRELFQIIDGKIRISKKSQLFTSICSGKEKFFNIEFNGFNPEYYKNL